MRDGNDGDGSHRPPEDHQAKIKIDHEDLPDGTPVPKLHVMFPGQDAPIEFRHASFVIPEDCGDDDASQQVHCLLINGKGEVWLDATTNEPIIVPAPPAVMRFDPQKHVRMHEAEKITGRSRTSIWRAVAAGELEAHGPPGKFSSYAIEALKDWVNRGCPTSPKRK